MKSRAYFAAGCFWCTEAIFSRINGVIKVTPGYTGGNIKNPSYKEVCMGHTGHAEGVEVVYESSTISYETLVLIFFTTHDPTTINRQGNDIGTQYRSAIFYNSKNEKEIISKVLDKIKNKSLFKNPIVTEIYPISTFYRAEKEHMAFFEINNQHPYCQAIISPKIKKFIKNYENFIIKN